MFIIQDGTTGTNTLKVDDNNRAHAFSVSTTLQGQAALSGDSYNINTGTINLTSANESGLAYLKNNGDKAIHILSVGYLIGNTTGGSGDMLATIKRNPTAGTVVSGASNVDININKNFSNTKQLTVSAFKGSEGATLTDGESAYFSLLPKAGNPYFIDTGTIVLERSASIGVCLKPQVGNTSMDVQVFFACLEYNF